MFGIVCCLFPVAMPWNPFTRLFGGRYRQIGEWYGERCCSANTEGNSNARRIFSAEQKSARWIPVWCGFSHCEHVLWVNIQFILKCFCYGNHFRNHFIFVLLLVPQVRQRCRQIRCDRNSCPKSTKWISCWKLRRKIFRCHLSNRSNFGRMPNSIKICHWCCW